MKISRLTTTAEHFEGINYDLNHNGDVRLRTQGFRMDLARVGYGSPLMGVSGRRGHAQKGSLFNATVLKLKGFTIVA